jgi:hypothetical protein
VQIKSSKKNTPAAFIEEEDRAMDVENELQENTNDRPTDMIGDNDDGLGREDFFDGTDMQVDDGSWQLDGHQDEDGHQDGGDDLELQALDGDSYVFSHGTHNQVSIKYIGYNFNMKQSLRA